MVVGKAVDTSEMFWELASLYGSNIISDVSSFQSSEKFITRPLDRVEYQSNKVIVWEVLDKKNEENDEWLYELERSKENNKFKEYAQVFQLLDEKYWDDKQETDIVGEITKSVVVLEQFKSSDCATPVCEKLLDHFQRVLLDTSSNFNSLKDSLLSYSSSYISHKLITK